MVSVSHEFRRVPPPHASIGHWLPKDRAHIKQWLATKLEQLEKKQQLQLYKKIAITLDPSIVALKHLVDASPNLTKLSREMFTQIPPAYKDDPTGQPQVRDFDTMLGLVDMILKEGPQWFDIKDPPTAMGLIGFPINAILDWPMGTLAGYLFFMDSQVNKMWQGILDVWGAFLQSPASVSCLNENSGWLSTDALNALAAKGNDGKTQYTFQQLYACNPALPSFGFGSWDQFFTRKFNPGIRPVAFPDDQPTPEQPDPTQVIVNACESTPLQFATDVKLRDTFWLKEQPYSLAEMLDNHPNTEQFVGGSVYQAFLSALSYHCWHAPVSGTVVDIRHVPGSYYSENLSEGFANPGSPDAAAPNNSQPYISAVAARGIIFIQADNPHIGLMAIIFIGMAEVSSCEFTVQPGQHIDKGQAIGMFHFGGSTHCLVFRPETKLTAQSLVNPPPYDPDASINLPVSSALAVITPPAGSGD
ncbi:hypothetical protein AYL99_10010 [Fonsecaea erecta]|uniref:L-tryptophan decarboxylase PsiD-like domain-containing protein n=1 Tax=Fonsecaea erecta TaxID=1367422 RepID=A0A178Z7T6_9EURO|nr:hypothetical protein AYL99_10010 [Fonsecaea erecta]OAP55858.1 hypothetical protein AYL99_10010 [Fonsecaea erecta]